MAAKVRRALTQPIHVGGTSSSTAGALPADWVADIGIGMSLRKGPDGAASAVATARAMSRAALAIASRIASLEQREAKVGA